MIGRRGQLGWATGLLAVLAVVAAAAAAARPQRLTPVTPGTMEAAFVADDSDGQRERIIEAVQKRFNAKVVRVTDTTVNGRPALALRLLSEQRVWNLVVDATTGQILSGA
jgi:nucleotide-binding universal stress UspA family protein